MPEIKTTYPQEPVIVEGLYPATLKEVTSYTATYEGKETEKLAWVFDVQAPESAVDEDVEIEDDEWSYSGSFEMAFHTSYATGPKSKMRPMLEAMLGDVPKKLDTDSMIGKPAQVYVVSYESRSGNTQNVIDRVSKPKKNQKTESAPAAQAEGDEKDFDAIPF